MTNAELKLAFNVYYDSIANLASPGYEPEEINQFLNKASDTIIEQLYSSGRLDDLIELMAVSNRDLHASTLEFLGPYGFEAALESDYWFFIEARIRMSRTSIAPFSSQYVPAQLIPASAVGTYVTTPVNKPVLLHPKIVIHTGFTLQSAFEGKVLVVVDKYSTISVLTGNSGLQMTYVKFPPRIDVSGETYLCPLSETFHDKVAYMAAQMAIQVTDKERVAKLQQQSQQQQKQA